MWVSSWRVLTRPDPRRLRTQRQAGKTAVPIPDDVRAQPLGELTAREQASVAGRVVRVRVDGRLVWVWLDDGTGKVGVCLGPVSAEHVLGRVIAAEGMVCAGERGLVIRSATWRLLEC